jgi:hypothetical protein
MGEDYDGYDGIITIEQIKYTIDEMSDNPNDNIFVVHNPNIKIINIKTFLTHIPFGSEEYYSYDLREPKRKIINPDKIRETNKTVINTRDWSNIPHYPTTREKRENVAKYLMKMGRAVPPELLKQIEEDKRKEIKEDIFNKNMEQQEEPIINNYNQISNSNTGNVPIYQHFIQNNHISKIPIHSQKPPHKYSPQYASYVNAKPRAQASARVGLGGVY